MPNYDLYESTVRPVEKGFRKAIEKPANPLGLALGQEIGIYTDLG